MDVKPLGIGLIGRILDIVTTEWALQNPLNYEGLIYQNYLLKLVVVLVVLLPQLVLVKYPQYKKAVWGSYAIALLMFLLVVNNLFLL